MTPILEALSKLDPENGEHWTSDGAPRVDVVQKLAGVPNLTRAQIVEIAPKFTREARVLPADDPQPAAAAIDEAEDLRPEAKRYLEIADELAELHAQKGEIENRMAKLAREQAALERFSPVPRGYDHKADQEARMEWIASQHRQRSDRASRLRAMAEAVKADSRSPIDQAYAHRPSRTTQRPVVPVLKQGAR